MKRIIVVLSVALLFGSSAVWSADVVDTTAAQALLDAARTGDNSTLNRLLRDGVDVNAAEGDGTTALHLAVSRNQEAAARLLLEAGANAQASTELLVTPLQLASANGNMALMRLLLDHGADTEALDFAGETLLMTAARSANAETLQLLIEHGVNLEAGDTAYAQTALMHAARAGNVSAVAALLAAGANVEARTRVGETPPFRPNGGTRGDGVEKAPARGMRTAIPGGKTALLYAARDGHTNIVQQLLAAGADIDAADPNGVTPLLMATSNNRMDVARLLIESGANINADDWYGRTALWSAIDVRNVDTPNPPTGNGVDRAPVLQIIELLLARGAEVNSRIREMPVVRRHVLPLGSLSWVDFTGETPLIRAALAGDVAVMRLLLQHGADPQIATEGGTTALMAAAGVNWVVSQTWDEGPEALLEAVKICFEAGIDVNAVNTKGIRAIHGAANRGSDAIIQFLADHGADLTAADSEGRTALDWAHGVFLATHPPIPKPETAALLEKLLQASSTQ